MSCHTYTIENPVVDCNGKCHVHVCVYVCMYVYMRVCVCIPVSLLVGIFIVFLYMITVMHVIEPLIIKYFISENRLMNIFVV